MSARLASAAARDPLAPPGASAIPAGERGDRPAARGGPGEGVLRRHGADGCVRLDLRIDAERLGAELDRLPEDAWEDASRDPVVMADVASFFAIGHPRGPRPRPPEDRAVLDRLPALRALLRERLPATPTRAIVARLAAGGFIPVHSDTARFFDATLRLSIQVDAGAPGRLFCDGRWYALAPGEVWAIDNLRPHAVLNPGATPRRNVLVDCVPSAELLALVDRGAHGLGRRDDAAEAEMRKRSRAHYRRHRWRAVRYEIFRRLWRRG